MPKASSIQFWSLILGTFIAALAVGVLIEFGRSEEIRFAALANVWSLAAIAYAIPLLWFSKHRRSADRSGPGWLAVPILGTILVQLMVVQIPNMIALWRLSDDPSLGRGIGSMLPMQAFNFLLFFLFYSTISCMIIGLIQLAGLGCEWLRKTLQN